MFGLSQFFNNIQKTFAKEFFVRNKIKEIIKRETNIDIKMEDITVNNGVISLKKQSPAILSVVYIKKTKIIDGLNNDGLKVVDIR